ncbi:hypothetical protein ACFX13_022723 [Malus domestica]
MKLWCKVDDNEKSADFFEKWSGDAPPRARSSGLTSARASFNAGASSQGLGPFPLPCPPSNVHGDVMSIFVETPSGKMVKFEVKDCKTLDFYDIEESSTLEVLLFWFQIFIKMWSGKTITLDVTGKSTVKEVKDKIFCKVRMPVRVQSIVVAGKRLDDECCLSSYNIQKGSTLHMVLGWRTKFPYHSSFTRNSR